MGISSLGALVVSALKLYADWPKKTEEGKVSRVSPLVVVCALAAVVLSVVGYDIYDRRQITAGPSLVSWGGDPNAFHMTVTTQGLQEYAKTHRLLLIVRPNLIGVDPMTDMNIGKSPLFTIAGPVVTLAIPGRVPLHMVPNQVNMLDFYAARVPVGVTADRIHSVGDIADLGGAIVLRAGAGIMAGPPVDQSPSPTLR
uniref:hypothetical protein n=1 Tax=Bradyrhizobium sp. (strain ORS 278) TaxID=114615 RepID=UPI0012FF3591|nr:hypothetical protein [Bradyrhizobium sp. ORS 278]